MATLQELMAKKGLNNESTPSATPAPAAPAAPKFAGFKRPGTDSNSPTPVDGTGSGAPVAGQDVSDSNGAASPPVPSVADTDAATDKPVTGLARLAGLQLGKPAAEPAIPESPTGTYSLADIEDMDASIGTVETPMYTDMVPADMPPRELPEELTPGQQEFIGLIEGIYRCFNDPQMFGNVIRNMMQELQSNNEYDKLIVDADVNALMAGLRSSMGMAKIKKAEKTSNRGNKTSRPAKVAAMGSALDDMFDESDFD